MNTGQDFGDDGSRFSWCLVEVFMVTGQDFFMNGQNFQDDVSLLCVNSVVWREHLTIQPWWATARQCSHVSLPYPSSEWYITCLVSVVCGAWGLLLWFLVAFSENGFIVKTNRGIVWSEGLLLGTSVVGSYTGKWQPRWKGDRNFIFFLTGPMDVLELRGRKKGVLRTETYSNV